MGDRSCYVLEVCSSEEGWTQVSVYPTAEEAWAANDKLLIKGWGSGSVRVIRHEMSIVKEVGS